MITDLILKREFRETYFDLIFVSKNKKSRKQMKEKNREYFTQTKGAGKKLDTELWLPSLFFGGDRSRLLQLSSLPRRTSQQVRRERILPPSPVLSHAESRG